jgi:predicted dehydrogenase
MTTPVSLGVVGLGTRGTALARAFDRLASAEVRYACAPGRFDQLLADETLDAVVVASPAPMRGEHARRALEAGKHVLVEPPLALEAQEADELVRLAEHGRRALVTSHATHFHPAARRLTELVAGGRVGEVHYLYGCRQGLGRCGDETVLWGTGAAAVSTLLWVVGDKAVEALARGGPCSGGEGADVAFCHLRFATGIEAELRLSCVEPAPAQRLTVVGSHGMACFDALDAGRPLTVYETVADAGGAPCCGDVVSPRLPVADPLLAHCEHFLAAVSTPGATGTGRGGAAVVAVLEALQRSLERGGTREAIGAPDEPIAGVIRLPIRSA